MEPVYVEIQEFLKKHRNEIGAEEIVNDIKRGVSYRKVSNQQGDLHLIRLHHPVIMRQEIFLGNVLFNAYLGLTFKRVMESEPGGDLLPLYNDLSSFYVLVFATIPLEEMIQKVKKGWQDGFKDLYFSDSSTDEKGEHERKGYYGQFSTMLKNYFKSNIQPFPLMIVPMEYAKELEQRVRSYLLGLLESGEWQKQIANFTANFSFFYGQTSGGTGDVQSCPNFLRRLVSEYHVLNQKEMKDAFILPEDTDFEDPETKNLIQSKLFQKGGTAFYPYRLKNVFEKALQHFAHSIENSGEGQFSEWLFRYHREKGVFLDLTPEELLEQLVYKVTIAGRTVSEVQPTPTEENCLLCGYYPAKLQGATILGSDSFSKFHNHSVNRSTNEKRICLNCGIYAYLNIKLSGSKGAGMGQVPRQGNVVFHYGSYTSDELEKIIARFHVEADEIFKPKTEADKESNELAEMLDPDIKEMLMSIQPMAKGNDGGEALLFPINFGTRKLILFLLPGLNDDIQKRFDKNWYATLLMLSWLTETGGKEGPYYYLSLPIPEQVLSDKPVLVINEQWFSTKSELRRHSLFKEIVPKLSASRSKDGFKHQMMVAELVNKDPLGQLSNELRYWMSEGKLSSERREQFFKVYGKVHELLEMEGRKDANK